MTFKKPFQAVLIKLGKRYRVKARRERLMQLALPFAVAAGVVGTGAFWVSVMPTATEAAPTVIGGAVSGCRISDGDTIRCGDERIRLLAIDAPELPGHCRAGRDCAPGDAYASTDSLGKGMTGDIRIERFGTDRYGRTLASLTGDKGNLSCWQLDHHQAIYKVGWDNQMKIARTCPRSVL